MAALAALWSRFWKWVQDNILGGPEDPPPPPK